VVEKFSKATIMAITGIYWKTFALNFYSATKKDE